MRKLRDRLYLNVVREVVMRVDALVEMNAHYRLFASCTLDGLTAVNNLGRFSVCVLFPSPRDSHLPNIFSPLILFLVSPSSTTRVFITLRH
jgi:hypothetical protein